MKKHISYPSIEQFRNVCSSVVRQATFEGLDPEGLAIYNPGAKKPIITFKGTVKLHGTNAGVSYNHIDGIWTQSRENIITAQKDNAGFAFFVDTHADIFIDLIINLAHVNNVDLVTHTLTIFGEWVGKGIQKGVAISNLDKSLFVFGAKVSNPTNEQASYWIDTAGVKSPEFRIFNVEDYGVFNIDINFNMPQLSQNNLIDLTVAVENECPVGKAFGFEGTGEGIVFVAEYKGSMHRFKSKGEKHSITKVKVLNSVDTEKLNSIAEFVEYAVTQNRFEQGMKIIFGEDKPDVKGIADLMRWFINDIIKEESDTLASNGLEPKDIGKYVSNKVRGMFFDLLNKEAFAG